MVLRGRSINTTWWRRDDTQGNIRTQGNIGTRPRVRPLLAPPHGACLMWQVFLKKAKVDSLYIVQTGAMDLITHGKEDKTSKL